ncbi:MAG: succinylglutamate desuccinylase/aspartoacylase family protein, partial [Planctomycetota bacterium]
FGLPWIVVKEETGSAGLTEDLAAREGIPWITCELVPQNRIDQDSVAHGVRGIRNALRFHGILEEPVVAPSLQYEFSEDHTETVIRTPFEGLLVGECEKGDWVEAGQTVLRVLSLETLETSFTFEAPHDALVFNIGGTHWGEDIPESFVVFSGQEVGILKQPKHLH